MRGSFYSFNLLYPRLHSHYANSILPILFTNPIMLYRTHTVIYLVVVMLYFPFIEYHTNTEVTQYGIFLEKVVKWCCEKRKHEL